MRVTFDTAILGLLEASRLPANLTQKDRAKRHLSEEALVAQLEGKWKGISDVSPERRRAFNQLLDHIDGKSAQASRIDGLLGHAPSAERLGAVLDDLAIFHAYTATVTIAFIESAKAANGIMESSLFHWTRKSDPAFWAMISGFGSPRHDYGIVGAFTHHRYETRNGRSEKTFFDDYRLVE